MLQIINTKSKNTTHQPEDWWVVWITQLWVVMRPCE